jgi:hypothetical protein
VLFSSGSSSCVTNDFKLETRFMPHNVPGIYFMGGLANQAPFADGQLCIAAGATASSAMRRPRPPDRTASWRSGPEWSA